MKKILFFISANLILICLIFVPVAKALYIGIENIGPAPLAAISLNFNIETFQGDVEFFQVFSDRARTDPTNEYFPFYFDEYDMIAAGESFDTYLIPELTDTQAMIVGYGMSTFNGFSGGGGPNVNIVPDFTSVDLISSSPAVPLAVRVSFHSGGVPVPGTAPVPEPTTILLSSLGLAGMGAYLRKRKKK